MAAIANALHVVEGNYIGYRRTWRGSIISAFLNPVLFLAGMGFALGSMVDQGAGGAQLPIPFITFVATGLLAAAAMQTGFGEGAWPIMAGIKWQKVFDAIIVTPITVADLINGMLIWGAIHLAFTLSVFAVTAVAFGAVDLGPALLALVPAVLGGLAFQATATAITCRLEDETGLTTMFRFAILPMFLFSGTFFPISQLPDWLEPVAIATPLFHAVELVRKLALPDVGAPVVTSIPLWVHLAYLLVMTVVAWLLAIRFLRERLQK